MRTSELAPDRVEALLRGAPPETTEEALVERLVRTLRAEAPAASPPLRERVRHLARPAVRQRRAFRPRLLALGLAAAAIVAVVGAVVVDRAPRGDRVVSAPDESVVGGAEGAGEAPVWEEQQSLRDATGGGAADALVGGGSSGRFRADAGTSSAGGASAVPPQTGRAQDIGMTLELRLSDAEGVSAAANDAMRLADRLGGSVAASTVDARGDEGSALLSLRVPVARLEEAVLGLSELGTITAQSVRLEDLQGRVTSRENREEALRRAIGRDELRLGSGTLSPAERLEVELRLESLRAQHRAVRRAREALLRRAAYAEIQLSLHTGRPAPRAEEGGVAGAARDAWNLLGGLGAIAVFAAILLGPLVLLAAVAWALLRAHRRRLDGRLLEEPRPAAARPPS